MNSLLKLVWLAVGAFAIGTESYVIAGLLPDLAGDLGVSVGLAGQLITVFALAYAFGSPLLAVATADMERTRLLRVSLVVFAAFNVVAALAHTYAALMTARVGLALAAGTFMPAASAYAIAITKPEHRGRALAIVYTGLTVATVVGVPIGVIIGEHFGWRSTFIGVAGLAAIALIGLAFTLTPVSNTNAASLAERIAIARRPEVLSTLVITVVTLTGAFSIYAYLAPFLEETTGFSGNAIAAVLFLFGVGSALGNLVSGSASDRVGPAKVLTFVLSSLIVLFGALSLTSVFLPPHVARWVIVPLVAIWGFVGWSFPAAQQARLVAMGPKLAPITLSLNASAIYLGVSIGAFLGSLVVDRHAVAQIGWVGMACEVLALALLLKSFRRRQVAAEISTNNPPRYARPVHELANHR